MLVKNARYGFHHIPNWQWSVAAGAHSGYTLWSVWGGSGRLQIGSEDYSLQTGDIFLLDYQAPVLGTENRTDILEVQFLDFETDDPQWLNACPIHRRLDQLPFVLELFKRIASAQEAGDKNAMTLWAEALLLEYRMQPDRTLRSCYSEKIDSICHSFERHPEQHFDMRELARSLGLTPIISSASLPTKKARLPMLIFQESVWNRQRIIKKFQPFNKRHCVRNWLFRSIRLQPLF